MMLEHRTRVLAYIEALDKTREDAFAEALLMALSLCTDDEGRLLNLQLGTGPEDSVKFAKQIANAMVQRS